MTQEEKEILLKELSVRAFYGVQAHYIGGSGHYTYEADGVVKSVDISLMNPVYINFIHTSVEHTKPYLRPMSSMTESEIDKLFDVLHIDKDGNDEDWIKINDVVGIKFFFPTGKWVENVAEAYDYLNSIHIDYRGLIPMGLALEAPEGMY